MSSRIYVKPNMKVIPLEAEGLAPLSANGMKIQVPDVIPEPGGGCRRSLCKRLRQQHLGDGIRNLPPPIRTFLASSLHVARVLPPIPSVYGLIPKRSIRQFGD